MTINQDIRPNKLRAVWNDAVNAACVACNRHPSEVHVPFPEDDYSSLLVISKSEFDRIARALSYASVHSHDREAIMREVAQRLFSILQDTPLPPTLDDLDPPYKAVHPYKKSGWVDIQNSFGVVVAKHVAHPRRVPAFIDAINQGALEFGKRHAR